MRGRDRQPPEGLHVPRCCGRSSPRSGRGSRPCGAGPTSPGASATSRPRRSNATSPNRRGSDPCAGPSSSASGRTRIRSGNSASMLETHRRLYNACLDERKARYEAEKVTVKYADAIGPVQGRAGDEPLLCPAQLQQSPRPRCGGWTRRSRTSSAGSRPKAEKAGYPRFRGRDRYDSVEFPVARRRHPADRRPAPRPARRGDPGQAPPRRSQGTIKTVTLKREAEKWYVVLSCDLGDVRGRAEHEPAGRHRRGAGEVPQQVGRDDARAQPPLPQGCAPRTPAEAAGLLPEDEGRQEPPQGARRRSPRSTPGWRTCGASITTRSP